MIGLTVHQFPRKMLPVSICRTARCRARSERINQSVSAFAPTSCDDISGFQVYAAEPHLLMTTLRNPLELYVSGEQYLNRQATSTLPAAMQFIAASMRKSLQRGQPPGFLHRFVGRSVMTSRDIREATVEGAYNLRSFWLVGVVEQYKGFISVMQALLDPWKVHSDMWSAHLKEKLNVSPVRSSNVLAGVDPQLVHDFNSTLSYQWLIYGHAARLFEARCQEVLPEYSHGELCHVPSPPVSYSG